MKTMIIICDLCDDLGTTKLAVASYRAKDGEEYDVCESCLEKVKEAKLLYRRIRQ